MRSPDRVRPLDALALTHPDGRELARRSVTSPELADNALGVPVCAFCRDPGAVPVLAGDRAHGPDHLYLICDRCGARWQRYDALRTSAFSETARRTETHCPSVPPRLAERR